MSVCVRHMYDDTHTRTHIQSLSVYTHTHTHTLRMCCMSEYKTASLCLKKRLLRVHIQLLDLLTTISSFGRSLCGRLPLAFRQPSTVTKLNIVTVQHRKSYVRLPYFKLSCSLWSSLVSLKLWWYSGTGTYFLNSTYNELVWLSPLRQAGRQKTMYLSVKSHRIVIVSVDVKVKVCL